MDEFLAKEEQKTHELPWRETKEVISQPAPCGTVSGLESFEWDLVEQQQPFVQGVFDFGRQHHANGPPIIVRDYRPATIALFQRQAEAMKQLRVYLDAERIESALQESASFHQRRTADRTV